MTGRPKKSRLSKRARSTPEILQASSEALARGRRDEAIRLARIAVAEAPSNSYTLQTLADSLTYWDFYRYNSALRQNLCSDGSITEAISVLKTLANLHPERSDVLVQIGYCFTALGDYKLAALYLREATDLATIQSRPDLLPLAGKNDPALAPSYFVLGVHKCGTTSLFDYIADHPLVLAPIVKETEYFINSERGLEWYRSHFPRRPAGEQRFVTGEASVGYFERYWLPEKLREFCPGARLMMLARDPVDRAISHFYNNKRWGVDHRPLEVAMEAELAFLEQNGVCDEYWRTQQGYLGSGVYSPKLENWLSFFPREQLLILVTEEMKRDPAETMVSVFQHLRLPRHEVSNLEPRHEGDYKNQMDAGLTARLSAFFAPHNERFFEVLGRKLEWISNTMGRAVQVPATVANEAHALSLCQRWSEASSLWQQCLEEWPEHRDRKDWLIGLANALLKNGEIESARFYYSRLAEEFPADASGPINLLEIARKSEDQEGVVRWLETCVRRFPTHPDVRYWLPALGHAMLKRGKVAEAEKFFQQATETYPQEAGGWAGLAVTNQLAGRSEQARSLWEDCLKRYPGHVGRRWWLPTYAKFLLSMNEHDLAESLLNEMKAEFPQE
jgi:tetratricopeptide (TPR) repeat protein